MLGTSVFESLRFLALAASFALSSGCGGRLASTDDDPCAACQVGSGGTGACQADNIAVGQYGPIGIAVAGSKIFWTNYGRGQPNDATVMKGSLRGGDPVALAVNQESVRAIAADAANVYWASGNVTRAQDIFRIGHDGGVPTLLAHAGTVHQIVVHGSIVYWTEGSAVRSVPIEGGTVRTFAENQDDARGLAVDDTHVYWSNWGHGVAGGGVFRLPIQAGEPKVIAQSPGIEPWALAQNDTSLFVVESSANGIIWKIAKDGKSNGTVALDVQPRSLAADATRVYWTRGSTLLSKDLAADAVTPLDTPAPPIMIATDETRVYWTSIGQGDDNARTHDGSVWSVCKPR